MKKISVVIPCYNEEENVEKVYQEVTAVCQSLTGYSYELIFIDNASKDRTVAILKEAARKDKRVKIIINRRNFGYVRSPYYALLQARGDAAILMAADLQDPPHLIGEFIKKWEAGHEVVLGVKPKSEETLLMSLVRRSYYKLVNKLSNIELIENVTGFGLYDKRVLEILRELDDPHPYLRGLVSEVGFDVAQIEFHQPARKRGLTKSNFYSLYDVAMLGITSHSKVPLRLAAMLGFALAIISLLTAFGFFVIKLIFWSNFTLGIAPIVIGLFFFASVQLFFLGVIGEYIGSIHTQVLKRPLVIEKERINFEDS